MRKFFRSFSFLLFIIVFSNTNAFAKSSINGCVSEFMLSAPPTGIYDRYYCKGNVALPLTASPSAGGTLNWYGTNATGGSASTVAPIPSTAIAGSITYYVSQTVGGVESTRSKIVVNVDMQLGLFCDGPKATLTSVEFDFANVGQTSFNYSYSVSGGAPITGSWSSPSHYAITGLLPGQSVTYTITAVGAPPCVIPSQTDTCYTICTAAQKITPTFSIPTTYCISAVTTDLPEFSDDFPSIEGKWSSSKVDTSTKGTSTYTFTPDPIKFPCALPKSLPVTVAPTEPDFMDLSVCSGDVPPKLEDESPNGVKGFWSPVSINNTTSAFYDFTPDLGQPCTPTNKTIYVTVNPSNVISSLNWTVTEAFSKNQIVTVTNPVGVNYLYQLDLGPFQTAPFFENVASGLHSITVNDVNGCSEFTDNNVLIIGYPKFFTPNGDSYNDTWNIPGLKDQLNSRIYIFDRYGKLLKDISPKDSGWDGTYIGQPMPADDYWFNVEYLENSVPKKFKSHFSLKR